MERADAIQDKAAMFILSDVDDYGLTADEFRILARVARRGDCTESVASISESTHISERQVRYALRVLLACRILAAEERIGATTIYRVRPLSDWVTPSQYQAVRKATLIPNPDKKPVHKGTAATAGGTADGAGLQEVQGRAARDAAGTAATAAKGNPSKEIPEGNPQAAQVAREADSPETLPCRKCGKTCKAQKTNEGYLANCPKCGLGAEKVGARRNGRDYYLPNERFCNVFKVRYAAEYKGIYAADAADVKGYERLKQARAGELTEENQDLAIKHFFETPREDHRFSELCSKFLPFVKSSFDRFNKPVEATLRSPPKSAANSQPYDDDLAAHITKALER